MRYLRFIGKIAVGLLALIGLAVVLAGVGAAFAWRYLPQVSDPVPDSAVLTLDLADGLTETLPDNPLARASFAGTIRLRDLVQGLDAAARDDRVKGLVARLGPGPLGMGRAQEIRDAVIAFRQQGKFALAFAESFGEGGDGNAHYYLATAFDQIWLQPSGDIELTGVLIETPFFKETLELLGVRAQMDQREEYKGGADRFTADRLPEPQRQNLQRLTDAWLRQIAEGIAYARKIDVGAALTLIDRGPFAAAEAKTAGLVDRLAYADEIDGELAARAGEGWERYPLASYAERLPEPPDSAPRIALVYGLGPVHLGGGGSESLFGEVTMAADTVSAALAEAIDDADVKAVIFRIDSPGGSYVASDTIRREVDRARQIGKPIIVSMGDVAASGGYFVAAPAHAIVAEPGTVTGSIGVYGGKLVLSGLWRKLGMDWDAVQSGANADIASANRPYSPAAWAFVQASLDRIYEDFTAKVADGRRLAPERVREVAKGQVWSGADAKELGLVDELGGLATALSLARSTAGIPASLPIRLEQFPREGTDWVSLVRRVLDIATLGGEQGDVAAWRQGLGALARLLPALDGRAADDALLMPEFRRAD